MDNECISIKTGEVIGPHPRAVEVGKRVLAEGGNAVDAAVAAAWVSAVVRPDQNGICGYGGAIVIHFANEKQTHCIDFDTEAPGAAHENMYSLVEDPNALYRYVDANKANQRGYLCISVPGTVAGLSHAAEKFGTMSLSDLIQPAIQACYEGFDIDTYLAGLLKNQAETFMQYPGTKAMFYPNGEPLPEGTIVPNPESAEVLKAIAKNGPDAFYKGEIAHHIAKHVQQYGGILTYEDMAAYRPRTPQAIEAAVGNLTIMTAPPPAGGISPLQATLVSDQLSKMIDLEPNSPEEIRSRLEVLRLVWWDRFDHLGDPAFVSFPYLSLIESGYAGELAFRVKHVLNQKPTNLGPESQAGQGGTVHISAVDKDCNLVSLTLTHGLGLGSAVVIPGTGMVMSGGMFLFDPAPGKANSPAPRKRPLNNMSPTIILKDGEPFITIGATGGRKIIGNMHSALVHIARGLNVREAFLAPRIHFETRGKVFIECASPETQEYLRAWGFDVCQGSAELVGIQLDLDAERIISASWRPK
ncbi:MAG: gamma-glutamyltransferase [Armatimonadota bacterium]|nr:gamma-glutamyltransferase [Armatimonadota bacterium]